MTHVFEGATLILLVLIWLSTSSKSPQLSQITQQLELLLQGLHAMQREVEAISSNVRDMQGRLGERFPTESEREQSLRALERQHGVSYE